jgi:hypothetical protein
MLVIFLDYRAQVIRGEADKKIALPSSITQAQNLNH